MRYYAWKAIERICLALSGAFIAMRSATLGVVFLTVADDAGERARSSLGLSEDWRNRQS